MLYSWNQAQIPTMLSRYVLRCFSQCSNSSMCCFNYGIIRRLSL